MTTLRVIVDDILLPGGGPLARYAEDLTRALIQTAPRGSEVAGVVASSPEGDYARIRELLTGLRQLHKSSLARRELAAAWQHGFTALPGTGMVHAPSLFAALRRHDRSLAPGDQTVVTIHDAIAWTHPELLPARAASSTKAMGRRAERHADAVVVPTHAVAADLAEHLDLGDRVRVIGAAPATTLIVPADAESRRTARGLHEPYVVALAEGDATNGFADLTDLTHGGLSVVLLAGPGDAAVIDAADRVTVIDDASAADRAAILAGAAVFVQPSVATGPPAALLDALALGLPIVATDLPGIAELTADAAILVERGDDYPAMLTEAIRGLLDDSTAAEHLGVAAQDRAKAFTWRDAAEKIWQLHADL
jgi:glycosyltransferase involved in cell wall biosynthesis